MRKSLLFLAFLFSGALVFAQMPEMDHCGTMYNLALKKAQDPGLEARMQAAEDQAGAWLEANRENLRAAGGVITIPVVVHVVYKDQTQNISDAQIFSQIDVLNADYRRMNADTANTRAEFDSLAADMQIEFCLATVDPDGNPTTGITRTETAGGTLFGFFGPTDDVKSPATGGVSAWPRDEYLNIWVCDLFPIILGYAQFPGEADSTDGVVIGYNYFGTTGTVSSPYDKGRTTIHEVGHWLGLRHIWGDGDCSADDFVSDTPLADASSSGCDLQKNSCTDSPYDYNDMVENYMDYSEDGCMNMFTFGQRDRAMSFLNTDRLPLQSSGGCAPIASVEEAGPSLEFNVWPNPSAGNFHLELLGQGSKADRIVVSDALGREIWEMGGEAGKQVYDITVPGAVSGMYFVTVEVDGRRTSRKLWITP